MSRRILLSLLFCLVTLTGAAASPLDDGVAAYRQGHWEEALRLLRPLAEQGEATAQELMGRLYERGKGVARNYNEAEAWYLKAAEQGNAFAQGHLGFLYRSGALGTPDYRTAAKWYREAAAKGNRLAQVGLGYMYLNETVDANDQEAAKWFRLAADQGDASGQLNLGTLYRFGKGVPRDLVEAHKWISLAANSKDDEYDEDVFARAKRELKDLDTQMTIDEIARGDARARAFRPR